MKAAVSGIALMSASDIEIKRKGVSYTYLTLKVMKKKYPEAELFWLIGADNVKEISGWRHPEQIARDCTLVVAARPGSRIDHKKLAGFSFKRLEARAIDISSSEIRDRLQKKLSIQGLVPESVECLLSQWKSYAPQKNK